MSETLTQYGTNFQSKMLTSLITDVKYTKTILDILEIGYFDSDSNKFIIKSIKDYFKKYKTTPTMEALKVIVDEVDRFSANAQDEIVCFVDELKNYGGMFIFTTNYLGKVDKALKSRCSAYHIKCLTPSQALPTAKQILLAEGVKVKSDAWLLQQLELAVEVTSKASDWRLGINVEIRTSYFRNVFRNPRAEILFLRVFLETIVFILVAAHDVIQTAHFAPKNARLI